MAIEMMKSAPVESGMASTQPELMVSAVLHLMSHYSAGEHETDGCTKLASVIERHLKALAALPELAPVLRATCSQLSDQWADVVERTMHPPEKANLLRRLVVGMRGE